MRVLIDLCKCIYEALVGHLALRTIYVRYLNPLHTNILILEALSFTRSNP